MHSAAGDGATKKLIVHCTEITVTHPSTQDIIQFTSLHDVASGVYLLYIYSKYPLNLASHLSILDNPKMCFVPYIPCLFSGFYISHQDNGDRRDDSPTVLTMNRMMMRQEVIGLTSGY